MERQQEQQPESDRTEEVDINDASDRYQRSADAMRAVRLNPKKPIPADQFPERTVLRGSAILRTQVTQREYAAYLVRVAKMNEAVVVEARKWWDWWEAHQEDPSKSGFAPLITPQIESALRVAAARRLGERGATTIARQPEHPVPGDKDKDKEKEKEKRKTERDPRPTTVARRLAVLKELPKSTQHPLASKTELVNRLRAKQARDELPPESVMRFERRGVGRDLEYLRDRELVDPSGALRRTPAGDSEEISSLDLLVPGADELDAMLDE